eukprot:TRINITY_DN1873_c0_g3_i1.p1 TRINITY_DN1873_c0_g3~~TRINITY_DN1873_c0_g3_i1.p1  ORF type:complete len:348 (+),score=77.02 TRINITY_DN1873_c0_g3_i1:31-1074(+)
MGCGASSHRRVEGRYDNDDGEVFLDVARESPEKKKVATRLPPVKDVQKMTPAERTAEVLSRRRATLLERHVALEHDDSHDVYCLSEVDSSQPSGPSSGGRSSQALISEASLFQLNQRFSLSDLHDPSQLSLPPRQPSQRRLDDPFQFAASELQTEGCTREQAAEAPFFAGSPQVRFAPSPPLNAAPRGRPPLHNPSPLHTNKTSPVLTCCPPRKGRPRTPLQEQEETAAPLAPKPPSPSGGSLLQVPFHKRWLGTKADLDATGYPSDDDGERESSWTAEALEHWAADARQGLPTRRSLFVNPPASSETQAPGKLSPLHIVHKVALKRQSADHNRTILAARLGLYKDA